MATKHRVHRVEVSNTAPAADESSFRVYRVQLEAGVATSSAFRVYRVSAAAAVTRNVRAFDGEQWQGGYLRAFDGTQWVSAS